MELFSIEHATNFIPCTRRSAECAEAKERSPPPRIVLDIAGIRGRSVVLACRFDPDLSIVHATPLPSLLNPRPNSHSSRNHPLHAQDTLFSILLCLTLSPHARIKFESKNEDYFIRVECNECNVSILLSRLFQYFQKQPRKTGGKKKVNESHPDN